MWLGTDVCGCAVVCVDFDGDAEALSKKPDGMLARQGAFCIMDLSLFSSNHIAYTCMLSGNMFSHREMCIRDRDTYHALAERS